ncbi:MAG: GNAT family N-acetyltransferase [Acidimicrobiales bacterium]
MTEGDAVGPDEPGARAGRPDGRGVPGAVVAGGVVVREAGPADYGEIGAITVFAYRALPGPPLEDGYAAHLADVAYRAANAVVIVAEDRASGRLLGSLTYVPDSGSALAEGLGPDEAGIRMLAVAPEAQGRGAGAALVRAGVDRARSDGKRSVTLHSTEWMTTAHRLYQRAGFRRAEERDWEVEPGFVLLGFAKDLGAGS